MKVYLDPLAFDWSRIEESMLVFGTHRAAKKRGATAFPVASIPVALKATIHKLELRVSDLDRNHFGTHLLTVARHPSENDERMMLRILAFAMFASERLTFAKGLSDIDEPELWETDLTGTVLLWIELGQPDARRLQKALARSREVVVLTYGRSVSAWWQTVCDALPRAARLLAVPIAPETALALSHLAQRNMRLDCTIQEGTIWIGNETTHVELAPERLLRIP